MKKYNKIILSGKIAFYLFLFAFIFSGIFGFVNRAGAVVAGDRCSDGTVYVSPTLRTTPSDAGMMLWAGEYRSTGAQSTTDGAANTNNLAARGSLYAAAYYCKNTERTGGYTDWYLPAKDELNTLYINRVAVGNFITSRSFLGYYYFSSTECYCFDQGVFRLYGQDFTNGNQLSGAKYSTNSVRCVRRPQIGEGCLSYALTINKDGTGSGTVTGAGTYNYNTPVTVTATPSAGSTFAGWSGACASLGTNLSGRVAIDSNKTCTATFNRIPTVTLSANPTSILAGASSTLTWNVTNATSCTATGAEVLWANSNLATSTGPHTWNTGILNTAGTSTYGIICTGAGGTASATTTVTVFTQECRLDSNNAVRGICYPMSPYQVGFNQVVFLDGIKISDLSMYGGSSAGAYEACMGVIGEQYAKGLILSNPSLWSQYLVIGGVKYFKGPPEGSVPPFVFPICRESVNSIPTVTLFSNPPSILAGASSTLTWNVTNATSCTATTATEETLHWKNSDLATSTGNHTWDTGILNTAGTSTYGIICAGAGGTASATTTVIVKSHASCSVSPTSATTGQLVTWTATSTGAVGPVTYTWIGDGFVNGKTTASVSGTYSTSTPSIKHATTTVSDGVSTSTIGCPGTTDIGGDGITITDPVINGSCVVGGQYSEKPTNPYLCLYGTPNPNPVNGGANGPWSWSCIGDGPGHTDSNCTATKLNPLDPNLICTFSLGKPSVSVNNNGTWIATSTRSFSKIRWTTHNSLGTSTPVTYDGNTLNKIFTTVGLTTVTAEIASSTLGVFGPPCSTTTTVFFGGGETKEI